MEYNDITQFFKRAYLSFNSDKTALDIIKKRIKELEGEKKELEISLRTLYEDVKIFEEDITLQKKIFDNLKTLKEKGIIPYCFLELEYK